MKKILLFTDSLVSGGAQRQIVGLAKLLHDKEFEVKLIYYHPLEFYKPYLEEYCVPYECVYGANDSKKRLFKIAKAIREFKPDVVISYLDVPNIITCLLKVCGMKFRLIVSERNTTQTLTMRDRVKFFLMRWTDVIIPNSYSQEKFINEHYNSLKNKVTTITNFVDTVLFAPLSSQKECKKYKEIISVGRICPQKNVKRFIESIVILNKLRNDFHISWYGKLLGDYGQECLDLVKKYGIENIIHFCGDNENIIACYHKSDIFILPSTYEGFPNVLCEAMSCGLPVLCSDTCDNPTIVKDGENGYLFNPYNTEDIVDKIETMLNLPTEELHNMGAKSRIIALDKFSAESFISKYIMIIQNI